MSNDEMSEQDINEQFRRAADRFIDLANRLADDQPPENIGMALLYAASRYNAFVVSLHADSLDKYRQDRTQAMEFFGQEYRRMLTENLEDYQQSFQDDLKYRHLIKKH